MNKNKALYGMPPVMRHCPAGLLRAESQLSRRLGDALEALQVSTPAAVAGVVAALNVMNAKAGERAQLGLELAQGRAVRPARAAVQRTSRQRRRGGG